jgi:muramoyltetrapeptide carboxypeptidase
VNRLVVFSPSGVVVRAAALRRAVKRLGALGFDAVADADALARRQRFAGDDATRLAALHRVAESAPAVALASRGGYGMTRLLDAVDWTRLGRSVERGTRWVGYSDLTSLHLALWQHAGVSGWAGPLAVDDFGRTDDEGGTDEVTVGCFVEAMAGELEAVGFRTEAGFDGLDVSGHLWGGNLSVLLSLLGTRHWPGRRLRGGLLFAEDVAEHPYRVERMLLQLHQAGVLEAQRAVLLGDFGGWKPSPHDRGYTLRSVVAHLRSVTTTPILTGLPIGHLPRTKVCLPVGRRAQLVVDGRDAWLAWGHVR